MPELSFLVRWPDGTRMECRSPSTILSQHLPAATYDLAEFLARARAGLTAASERVREVHGFSCARAAAQLHDIERAGRAFQASAAARVTVEFPEVEFP